MTWTIVAGSDGAGDNNGGDDHAVIRSYLYGLIRRDVSCLAPVFRSDQARQEYELTQSAIADQWTRDELRMLSLSESREDGFSLKYVTATRREVREKMERGWSFDVNVEAWAVEDRAEGFDLGGES